MQWRGKIQFLIEWIPRWKKERSQASHSSPDLLPFHLLPFSMKCCFTLLPLKLSHVKQKALSVFFPVHCTLKPPPNQIAHSCLVSNSVSQAMVNKPLPSPIPWQHAPFELVAVKCFFFFSLPLSLPLTLFFLTGRSRAKSQACMWHKTLNHHLPLSVNTVNVGLYSILYVLVCYSVECYSVVALSQPWRLTLFCISDFFHNVKFMVK